MESGPSRSIPLTASRLFRRRVSVAGERALAPTRLAQTGGIYDGHSYDPLQLGTLFGCDRRCRLALPRSRIAALGRPSRDRRIDEELKVRRLIPSDGTISIGSHG